MNRLQASLSRQLTLPGVRIGHGTDLEGCTGLTVFLFEEGITAVADIRGHATSLRQFDGLIFPDHIGDQAHALVFSGGSAFGLSAADEIVAYLDRNGHGHPTGARPVPIVPTAILFDLAFGPATPGPSKEIAREALDDASQGPILCGSVGAGTGATVGKSLGVQGAMKGGFGFASLSMDDGLEVAVAVAVNAFGDVIAPVSDRVIAGCRRSADSLEMVDARRVMSELTADHRHPWQRGASNTTLAAILTNADLDQRQLARVGHIAFGAFYRTLAPAACLFDGDVLVTLARREVPCHPHRLAVLAQYALEDAILEAIRRADGFGILPAVGDLNPL